VLGGIYTPPHKPSAGTQSLTGARKTAFSKVVEILGLSFIHNTDSNNENRVALVFFGVGGISGWAVTKPLFNYPTTSSFSQIIGLTNRPFDQEIS
jgi:hypothetical protein